MTDLFETDDPQDRRLARSATGVLAELNEAGYLEVADVHVASRLARIVDERDPTAVLALAVVVRALRHGSVCVDLASVAEAEPDLTWPGDGWLESVHDSALMRQGILRIDGGLVYLDRYWREETQVRDELVARLTRPGSAADTQALLASAKSIFGAGFEEQRDAAVRSAGQPTTVLTGGPGSGKTTSVAGLLRLLAVQGGAPLRIALAAPTGKAAARLQESVRANLPTADDLPPLEATTLHRLLGWRPDRRNRFRHDRDNRLPHDVVVIDETSMVPLSMMARLMEAVRADARLVLMGDPDQLTSVEAGAVLADLVAGLGERAPEVVVTLTRSHRNAPSIGALAAAVRDQDADQVMATLAAGAPEISYLDPGDVDAMAEVREALVGQAIELRKAAQTDPSAALRLLDRHRLLCAHRTGPFGVEHWNRLIERGLSDAVGVGLGGGWGQEWYVGRPVLVTSNDYGLKLFNGDTGVVCQVGEKVQAIIAGVSEPTEFATSRLSAVETMHAMTVHKSQGGQAEEITVVLPPEDSPLLTRELFYTALTRAQRHVKVIGTEASVRAAVNRRAQRASGLARRLNTPAVG